MAVSAAWPMERKPIRQHWRAVPGGMLKPCFPCVFIQGWLNSGCCQSALENGYPCIGMIFLPEYALLSQLVMCDYLLCPSLYTVPKFCSPSSKGTGPENFWLQNQIRLLCFPSQKCINTQWPKPKNLTLWNE